MEVLHLYRYAQLDDNNIVIGESFLSGEVFASNMIRLMDEQIEVGKMKYIDGEFVPYTPHEPEPTEQELVQAEMLLNQIEIMSRQAEQDEVLAEILLNQMGV